MCPDSEALVHAFLDGELAGGERKSFEMHLLDCTGCADAVKAQSRFKATLRTHLPRPAVPVSLERKMATALAKAPAAAESGWGWLAFPKLTPAFAAVGVVAVLVMVTRRGPAPRTLVMQQALRAHSVELPMDVEAPDCNRVASWFRGRLGFTVHPPQLERSLPAALTSSVATPDDGAHCQGGRIINVRDNFGAYLTYRVGSRHRINVTVFEGDDEGFEGTRRRLLAGQEVFFGTAQGASTAAFRGRDGLNYVLTSDLDEDTLSSVVEASFRSQGAARPVNGRP